VTNPQMSAPIEQPATVQADEPESIPEPEPEPALVEQSEALAENDAGDEEPAEMEQPEPASNEEPGLEVSRPAASEEEHSDPDQDGGRNRQPPTATGSHRSLGLSTRDDSEVIEQKDEVTDEARVESLLQRSRKTSGEQGPDSNAAQLEETPATASNIGSDSPAVHRNQAPVNVFNRTAPRRNIRPRRRRAQPQPAIRQKRLDRSRHVEYKYEMRGLMQETGIPEEHRSSLLGSIWAKGERQDIEAAKDFITEEQDEGKIDEKMAAALLKVVKRYTVRR